MPLLEASAEHLEEVLERIRAKHGSVDAWLEQDCGVDLGCGMSAVRLDVSPENLDRIRRDRIAARLSQAIPSGNAFIRPLDDNGNLIGVEHELVSRAKAEPSWEFDGSGGVLENPAMIHADGVYHPFYSGYRWQTAKYANGHAVCDAPFGPCAKTSKENPWQGSKGDTLGPGGTDFVRAADGTLFIYMHGWLAPDVYPNGSRKLWMYRMKVNGNSVSIAQM